MENQSSVAAGSTPAGQRVAHETLVQRRRRVIRSVLAVLAMTVVMVLLSLAGRDQQSIESCRQRMEAAVKILQESHGEWLRDPLKFPLPSIADRLGDVWREHVLDNWFYTEQAASKREVGVCCCERPHHRMFMSDGRYVIIFDVRRQRYELQWMDESRFAQRAEELGLHARRVRP